MVVTLPAGTIRRINLEYSIDDLQGILDQGITRFAHPETNQFKKARIHDLVCRILVAIAGPLVGELHLAHIRVFIALRPFRADSWIDADVVPRHSGY